MYFPLQLKQTENFLNIYSFHNRKKYRHMPYDNMNNFYHQTTFLLLLVSFSMHKNATVLEILLIHSLH